MGSQGIPAGVTWGKLREDREAGIHRYLPLEDHCLDVASVFRCLAALPSFRSRMDRAAGASLCDGQLDRLAVLALLHDFGKANLGFQDKPFDPQAPRAGHIRETAPLINEKNLAEQLTRALSWDTLTSWFDRVETLQSYFFAILSHHGKPLSTDDLSISARNYYFAKTRWWPDDGLRLPFSAIACLMQTARNSFPGAFSESVPPLPDPPRLQHRFAGLLMLADWLGSHDTFFPVDNGESVRSEHAPIAASRAVTTVGLDVRAYQHALATGERSFKELFGFSRPSPLQHAMDRLHPSEPTHRLLIAEAETGSGKTEAALVHFFRLFAAREVDGLYFALPTRVAARELFQRVKKSVATAFPDPLNRPLVLQAVPGYAQTNDEGAFPDPSSLCTDDTGAMRREHTWAAERPKRFLAATIAVGTIDQALLSAVRSPHAHLRSVCLDRQLLVVDEVHASDAYMGYLLGELLRHHVQEGHALLLSATLGGHARQVLASAAGAEFHALDLTTAITAPYPSLTDATGHHVDLPEGASEEKRVEIDCLPFLIRPEALLSRITKALKSGARVLVVCNTVGRAIGLQRAAERYADLPADALFRCCGTVTPHHGRYAPNDRERLDAAVASCMGKQSGPGALLLIGTQTLEQSLDIDADLLITDLCPMDVLLQRIGRLHRHTRNRPAGDYEQARCLLLVPEIDSLEPWLQERGDACTTAKRLGLGSVYQDLRILERTWETLRKHPRISIPRDNRYLVEMATHPDSLDRLQAERWQRHAVVNEGGTIAQNVRADQISLVKCYDQPFGSFTFSDLDAHAATRLGLGSLRLPLPEPVLSPFGIAIKEVLIPGHMAALGEEAEILDLVVQKGGLCFRLADKTYKYTRFGLEYDDESAD